MRTGRVERREVRDVAQQRAEGANLRERWLTALAELDWNPRRGGKAGIAALLTFTLWLNWSSSFYLLTVLAKPIVDETGWPLTSVVMGLSLGLVVAGLISPLIGGAVQRHGGRVVLALGSLMLAGGLIGMGLAQSRRVYFLGWALLGAGMAASLYEAAFAALGRLYGLAARGVISNLVLTIAFAVALSWPFTALLLQTFGWRGACLCYAGMHLVIGLPLHWFLFPAGSREAAIKSSFIAAPAAAPDAKPPPVFVWLVGANITVHAFIGAVVAVHLLALLQGLGIAYGVAVALGSGIWLAQGAGRLLEAWLGRRFHPVWQGVAASALVAVGVALLLTGESAAIGLGLVAYGLGNGVRGIVRGTLPLMLFGAEGYAVLMGRLGLPTSLSLAVGPALAALALAHWGALPTLLAIAGLSAANLALSYALRFALPRRHTDASAAGAAAD